ncbi:PREDICTED: uncharacterized protein LOC104988805 isoform X1 [Bison bison bison]|uniref:Uncharacterized protein LOC104988805 isoform X1 n=1 Tax=Bison bison bison TaxID=43346 RepID=A0A6P3H8X2_BISBB|nr:PREDICTED: uncharacterized protein LOC104988805 isoform X1 [Bison bison bison]
MRSTRRRICCYRLYICLVTGEKAHIILGEVPPKPVLPAPRGSPFSQSTSAWDSRKTNFRCTKRPELVPEADIVSQGTDLITKSLGEAGRKLLGWTAHPRAPGRRRGMEKRGTSLAWPPLGPPPPELPSQSPLGGHRLPKDWFSLSLGVRI